MLGAVARPPCLGERRLCLPRIRSQASARKAAATSARNTQRYRRHSRYPETWPGEICSLDSGNLMEVRPLPLSAATKRAPRPQLSPPGWCGSLPAPAARPERRGLLSKCLAHRQLGKPSSRLLLPPLSSPLFSPFGPSHEPQNMTTLFADSGVSRVAKLLSKVFVTNATGTVGRIKMQAGVSAPEEHDVSPGQHEFDRDFGGLLLTVTNEGSVALTVSTQ